MRGVILGAMLVALQAGPAGAAPVQPPLPPIQPPAAPAPDQILPPYQERLERLAELLGTLAFMRTLCGAEAGADWREKMSDLMGAEGVTPSRRDRLAGSFNRGFESYRLIYRTCTPAAETVIARSLAAGAQLAATLSRQFTAD